ncbi:MAG: hypothetical protein Tsb005_06670 [Gammaproteobacteria bacterium]
MKQTLAKLAALSIKELEDYKAQGIIPDKIQSFLQSLEYEFDPINQSTTDPVELAENLLDILVDLAIKNESSIQFTQITLDKLLLIYDISVTPNPGSKTMSFLNQLYSAIDTIDKEGLTKTQEKVLAYFTARYITKIYKALQESDNTQNAVKAFIEFGEFLKVNYPLKGIDEFKKIYAQGFYQEFFSEKFQNKTIPNLETFLHIGAAKSDIYSDLASQEALGHNQANRLDALSKGLIAFSGVIKSDEAKQQIIETDLQRLPNAQFDEAIATSKEAVHSVLSKGTLKNWFLADLIAQSPQASKPNTQTINALNATTTHLVSSQHLKKLINTTTKLTLTSENLTNIQAVNHALWLQNTIINPRLGKLLLTTHNKYALTNQKLLYAPDAEKLVNKLNNAIFHQTSLEELKQLLAEFGLHNLASEEVQTIWQMNQNIHDSIQNNTSIEADTLMKVAGFVSAHPKIVADNDLKFDMFHILPAVAKISTWNAIKTALASVVTLAISTGLASMHFFKKPSFTHAQHRTSTPGQTNSAHTSASNAENVDSNENEGSSNKMNLN